MFWLKIVIACFFASISLSHQQEKWPQKNIIEVNATAFTPSTYHAKKVWAIKLSKGENIRPMRINLTSEGEKCLWLKLAHTEELEYGERNQLIINGIDGDNKSIKVFQEVADSAKVWTSYKIPLLAHIKEIVFEVNQKNELEEFILIDQLKIDQHRCRDEIACDFEDSEQSCAWISKMKHRVEWNLEGGKNHSQSTENITSESHFSILKRNPKSDTIQVGEIYSPVFQVHLCDEAYHVSFSYYVPECITPSHIEVSYVPLIGYNRREHRIETIETSYGSWVRVNVSLPAVKLIGKIEVFKILIRGYLGLEPCSAIGIDDIKIVKKSFPNLNYGHNSSISLSNYLKSDNRSQMTHSFLPCARSAPPSCSLYVKFRNPPKELRVNIDKNKKDTNVLALIKFKNETKSQNEFEIYIGVQRTSYRISLITEKNSRIENIEEILLRDCNPVLNDALEPEIDCSKPEFKCLAFVTFENSSNLDFIKNDVTNVCSWGLCETKEWTMGYKVRGSSYIDSSQNNVLARDHTTNESGGKVAIIQRYGGEKTSISSMISNQTLSSNGKCTLTFYSLSGSDRSKLSVQIFNTETKQILNLKNEKTRVAKNAEWQYEKFIIPSIKKAKIVFTAVLLPGQNFLAIDDILIDKNCRYV